MKLLLRNLLPAFAFVLLFAGFAFAQENETEKGIELYQKGEYQKAVETLQTAVKTNKKDRDAWLYLGMSFAHLKKRGKAAGAFKKADSIPGEKSADNETEVKITSKPRSVYTDRARQDQVQGTISVAVEFGADGELKFIFVYQGLPDGLIENSIDAARQIKFEPATRDGKPVSAIKLVKYSFILY